MTTEDIVGLYFAVLFSSAMWMGIFGLFPWCIAYPMLTDKRHGKATARLVIWLSLLSYIFFFFVPVPAWIFLSVGKETKLPESLTQLDSASPIAALVLVLLLNLVSQVLLFSPLITIPVFCGRVLFAAAVPESFHSSSAASARRFQKVPLVAAVLGAASFGYVALQPEAFNLTRLQEAVFLLTALGFIAYGAARFFHKGFIAQQTSVGLAVLVFSILVAFSLYRNVHGADGEYLSSGQIVFLAAKTALSTFSISFVVLFPMIPPARVLYKRWFGVSEPDRQPPKHQKQAMSGTGWEPAGETYRKEGYCESCAGNHEHVFFQERCGHAGVKLRIKRVCQNCFAKGYKTYRDNGDVEEAGVWRDG